MIKIAVSLIGNGFAPAAVFAQLRSMYPADVTDREINDLIVWVVEKNPLPSGNNAPPYNPQFSPAPIKRVIAEEAIANTEKWLGDFRCEEYDLWEASPWRPLEDWRFDSLLLLAALYDPIDFINVVTDFTVEQQKASPIGPGKIQSRDDWLRFIRDHGTPQTEAGAWIRPNPVKRHGSGKNGASCDCDVTSYRFCLLESDLLPAELALPFFAALPVPVAAIISSGGKSPHAWIELNCPNEKEYREKVELIYSLLARFGFDASNRNPSRMSRLPGAQREIGKHGDGEQRLLYLNPEPIEAPIFERKK